LKHTTETKEMENNLNEVQKQVNKNDRFNLLSIDQFNKRPPMEWVVKNILPAQGLAIMFGKSGTGKTFLLLDLLLAIATRDQWFGHSINNTGVCYICLEGISGIHHRITAWEKASGRTAPNNFKIITDPLDLTKQKNIYDLAMAINDSGFDNSVIAVDTLNAATPRMDENSSKEMGNAIDNLKLLQQQTSSLVLTSHHTGKDERQGMRGHSSLHGAVDAAIYLKGTGSNRSWSLQKIRDNENGETHSFKLKIHELEPDADGEIITSCSIESDMPANSGIKRPMGSNQILIFNQVRCLIEEKTKTLGEPCAIPFETVIENAAPVLHSVEMNKRKNEAAKILRNLVNKSFLVNGLNNGTEYIGLP